MKFDSRGGKKGVRSRRCQLSSISRTSQPLGCGRSNFHCIYTRVETNAVELGRPTAAGDGQCHLSERQPKISRLPFRKRSGQPCGCKTGRKRWRGVRFDHLEVFDISNIIPPPSSGPIRIYASSAACATVNSSTYSRQERLPSRFPFCVSVGDPSTDSWVIASFREFFRETKLIFN